MDPYLESPAYWRDFHESFIVYWRDWLLDHLPDHYEVRIEERLSVLEDEPAPRKDRVPDLSISQAHPLASEPVAESAVATLDREPVTLRVKAHGDAAEAYLRLLHRPDATLITLLELLSPTNKEGDGRQIYLAKRNELIQETVHLVELDLLLGGHRLPTEGTLPPGNYYAYVSRGDRRPDCEVYGWHLYEPLPRIRIPLKAPDPDVVFDLPALFAEAYRRGRYSRSLRYAQAPPKPLSPPLAKWVQDRLKSWKEPPAGGVTPSAAPPA